MWNAWKRRYMLMSFDRKLKEIYYLEELGVDGKRV